MVCAGCAGIIDRGRCRQKTGNPAWPGIAVRHCRTDGGGDSDQHTQAELGIDAGEFLCHHVAVPAAPGAAKLHHVLFPAGGAGGARGRTGAPIPELDDHRHRPGPGTSARHARPGHRRSTIPVRIRARRRRTGALYRACVLARRTCPRGCPAARIGSFAPAAGASADSGADPGRRAVRRPRGRWCGCGWLGAGEVRFRFRIRGPPLGRVRGHRRRHCSGAAGRLGRHAQNPGDAAADIVTRGISKVPALYIPVHGYFAELPGAEPGSEPGARRRRDRYRALGACACAPCQQRTHPGDRTIARGQ
ncbi:hypothetical protein SBBP2_880015 [Burkholderiales bacterium]|nr:hypothetical protein SBBP2_880015 [Burkholderiales bacterium]